VERSAFVVRVIVLGRAGRARCACWTYFERSPCGRITLDTVQSTLERLFRKGLLAREKMSHAYVYSAALSRAEYGARLGHDVVTTFAGSATPATVLSAFVDLAERTGEDGLARLERLIAERRASGKERP
jgi:predicted transcriptional regulator